MQTQIREELLQGVTMGPQLVKVMFESNEMRSVVALKLEYGCFLMARVPNIRGYVHHIIKEQNIP
jgi:hypothetical protein